MQSGFEVLMQKRSEPIRMLVVSDTHGNISSLEQAIKASGKVDCVIHLGDVVKDIISCRAMLDGVPTAFVRGNCDAWGAGEDELLITVGGVKILLVHGNNDRVNAGLVDLYYHALEHEATLALYGHTHIPAIDRSGSVWLVNPGSTSRPRVTTNRTCALIEIKNGAVYPGIIKL